MALATLFACSGTPARGQTPFPLSENCGWSLQETALELETFLKNPFNFACRGQLSHSSVRTKEWQYSSSAEYGKRANEFLGKVTEQAISYLDVSREKNRHYIRCLRSSDAECASANTFFANVRASSQLARKQLAIIHQFDGTLENLSYNASQSSPIVVKSVKWAPYSKDEVLSAKSYVQEIREAVAEATQVDSEAFRLSAERSKLLFLDNDHKKAYAKRLERLSIENIRTSHEIEYRKLMGNLNFLMFIRSANPTLDEIESALKEQDRSNEAETQALSKAQRKLKRGAGLSEETLFLLEYGVIVEEILLKHPEYCDLVAELHLTRNKRNAVISGTLLAADMALMLVPGAGPVASGARLAGETLFAGYWIKSTRDPYSAALRAQQATIHGEDGLVLPSAVESARSEYLSNLFMFPLSAVPVGTEIKRIIALKQTKASLRTPLPADKMLRRFSSK